MRSHDLEQTLALLGLGMDSIWNKEWVEGKKILEIGPGDGRRALWLSGTGAGVVAVDISAVCTGRLASALLSENGISLAVQANIEEAPFAAETFDGIYSQTVWMHLSKSEALSECLRVLKPGGRMVVVEPVKYNPFVACFRTFFSAGRFSSPSYLTSGDIESFQNAFAKSSFKFRSLLTPPMLAALNAFNNKFMKRILNFLLLLEDRIIERFPSLARYCWFVVMDLEK